MYRVCDAIGNSFFTSSGELAKKVVSERDNPFIKMVEYDGKVAKEHNVKSYEDFLEYFYQVKQWILKWGQVMLIDFKEKCEKLKKVIIASYDWEGESSFDKLLDENRKITKKSELFFETLMKSKPIYNLGWLQ